jgi:hypothetical protein
VYWVVCEFLFLSDAAFRFVACVLVLSSPQISSNTHLSATMPFIWQVIENSGEQFEAGYKLICELEGAWNIGDDAADALVDDLAAMLRNDAITGVKVSTDNACVIVIYLVLGFDNSETQKIMEHRNEAVLCHDGKCVDDRIGWSHAIDSPVIAYFEHQTWRLTQFAKIDVPTQYLDEDELDDFETNLMSDLGATECDVTPADM